MIKERIKARAIAKMEVSKNIFEKLMEIFEAKDVTLEKLERGGRVIDIFTLLNICIKNGEWILSHNEGVVRVINNNEEEFEFRIKGIDEEPVKKLIGLAIATKMEISTYIDDVEAISEILDIFFDGFYELYEEILDELVESSTECIEFTKGL